MWSNGGGQNLSVSSLTAQVVRPTQRRGLQIEKKKTRLKVDWSFPTSGKASQKLRVSFNKCSTGCWIHGVATTRPYNSVTVKRREPSCKRSLQIRCWKAITIHTMNARVTNNKNKRKQKRLQRKQERA